ncbi:MAG: molybdenum cofactor guanylyltransferase [Bacteroidales bacterium]|nr:molybdenum cofactor guanylyltransferase [Bacteroidales bacterium]MCF8456760.1 molybdenum cofactor guanylyltransferase [Bacteroidales bacterium]
MKSTDLCGIILAGGESKRMGRDKTILRFEGQSLVERMVHILSPFCQNILISSNNRLHQGIGYEVIADAIPSKGPIGGIYSCLIKSEYTYNMVLPADVPLISIELIHFLLENAHPQKISAIVTPTGFIEPLCAIYPTTIIPALKDFIESGSNKLIDFLEAENFHPVQLSKEHSFYHPKLLMNINTPEDFEKLIGK